MKENGTDRGLMEKSNLEYALDYLNDAQVGIANALRCLLANQPNNVMWDRSMHLSELGVVLEDMMQDISYQIEKGSPRS